MKRHFLATRAINVKNRRALEARVFFEQPQRLSILPECEEKTRVLFSSKLDHAQFRDHDRPTEDRNDREEKEDELAGDGSRIRFAEIFNHNPKDRVANEKQAGENPVRLPHSRAHEPENGEQNNSFEKSFVKL